MSKTNYTGVTKDDVTGKYLYYFKAGIDRATGKPYQERKRGFKTAKEAHEARIKAIKKVHDMGGMTHANMSFEQFIDEIYLPDYLSRVTVNKRYSQKFDYIQMKEFFGKKKPRNITIFEITRYKNFLLEKYTKNGARKKLSYLITVFNSLMNYGLVNENLVKRVGNVPVEKITVDYWTVDEFRQFIYSLDCSLYFEQFIFTMIWLYFYTGMRVSEGLALYWSDIDFKKRKISISHNLDYANKHNWERKNKLKTEKSKRVISIDDTTVEVLKEWKIRQKEFSKQFEFVLSYDLTPNDAH